MISRRVGGLSRAGFANDGEAFAFADVEAQAVHRLDGADPAFDQGAPGQREVLADVRELKDGGPFRPRDGIEAGDGYRWSGEDVVHVHRAAEGFGLDAGGAVQPVAADRCQGGFAVQAGIRGQGAARRERAAGGAVEQVRRHPLDGDERGLLCHVHARDSPEQAHGVGHPRVVVNVVHGPGFHGLACVHDHDVVGHSGHDAEVVRNHDDGGPGLLLRLVQHLEDLGLDGDVQCRRRLIGDQDARVVGDGDRDHDALAHAAGEFVREGFEPVLGAGDSHHGQEFDGAGFLGLLAHGGVVDGERFDDLGAHGEHRGEGRQRVLEDHREIVAAVLAHGLIAQSQQLAALEPDGPGDLRRRREEAHDGQGRDRFAGTRFTHDSQGAAGQQVEIDAPDGVHNAVFRIEADVQVTDGQDGVTGGVQPCHLQALHG
ncbi:hypothetical protein QF050_000910 [Arthrobacter sp. SLBN-112]|nr:hypothetical protein [Arthrobacter sp. SLBN-112]